jgi:hypothetical protein
MTAFNATCRLKDTDEVLTVFPVPNIAFGNGAPNFKSGEPSTRMEELLLDAAAEASCDRQSTQDKS